ncbi:hypothetical protein ACVIW2_003419 [Bradyrhizobium huanghuaihaiense]
MAAGEKSRCHSFVARMERSAIRDHCIRGEAFPDFATLHPGYAGLTYPSNTASAAATESALSVTVRSSAPACTLMFSAKKRASET